MTEKNANQFPKIYEELNIKLDKLGCVMLDLDGEGIEKIMADEDLYYTQKPAERFWIKGFVAGHTPHVTLLYGLLQSANTTYRKYVDEVLKDWSIATVGIDHVGYFDSPYPDEPYYCLVAHLLITAKLKEGHNLLQLLPHINTFPEYKAHITIAYIRKDETLLQGLLSDYNEKLHGLFLKVKGINYGK